MKWSTKTLDNAIDLLLPTKIKKSKDNGVYYNPVKLMSIVAEDQFIKRNVGEQKLIKYNESIAILIVAEAMSELFKDSEINYGTKEFDFD